MTLKMGIFNSLQMRLNPFITKVYWNKSNGEKLIGTESVGCGPVCDSSLDFHIDNGKTIVSCPL